MLEHSAMYLNVPSPFEEETSLFPDFYTRLGPCELQDPVWAKMSALSAGVNKKRKKSETKPQAQINKCNNEKRRREQENIYIEELAELISANFADMSSLSVKPDKCAILQETVNQIRSIKQRENTSQSSDPVQQGEVSSSRPTILSNEVFGPLLLEALEGFLFVVSGEGKVEHVTENVSTYIKFSREEVLGKSIYNFIHHGDHARFSSCLLPMMSLGWTNNEPPNPPNKSRSFTIRLLVKPSDDLDESVEEKQQRVSCYEMMTISSTQLRDQVTSVVNAANEEESGGSAGGGSETGPCLLCVASRITHRDKVIGGIEQFTTKLDTNGKIIGVDTQGVSATYSPYINKDLMHRVLKELVPQQDVQRVTSHLKETLNIGQSTSLYYRIQLAPDKCVQVQTKSKLFKTNPHTATEADFIMATHSIIGENDALGPSDPGGGNHNNNNNTSSNTGVGGPLMTSVVNGTRNGSSTTIGSDSSTTSSNTLLSTSNTNTYNTFNLDNDFINFDMFPTSTWDLESASSWPETRPDSRQSITPVSTPTPRPPSNPSYSPATTVAQSPIAHQFVTQPSPTLPNPSTPANNNPYSNFSFSPITTEQTYSSSVEEQKDTKANVMEEATSMMADSNRLRNLLTKPVESANDSDNRNKNRILKGLLNQQDEDDNRSDNRASPRVLLNRTLGMSGASELPNKPSGRNNMLLELLNDKSDDDDLEARAGIKKKGELLQQLLKPERDEDEKKNDIHSQDDCLLRSLGFNNSPSPPGDGSRSRKRPSDDRDENPNKKSDQVSSTGSSSSKLCEKNKMLASLLAKQPSPHQTIPPIPASIISATPQEKLPRIADANIAKNINSRMMNSQPLQQPNLMNNVRVNHRMANRPPQQTTNYLNSMLSPANNLQQTDRLNQTTANCYTSPATSSTDNNHSWNENNNLQCSNETLLSDILDEVLDIVPDDIMHLLDTSEQQQQNSFQNEKQAISFIQRSLMQFESAVRSPTSPTISISGTPPAYPTSTVANQNNQGRGFPPPPPNYPQQGYRMNQQRISQVRPNAPNYTALNTQQILMQKKLMAHQQQQEKRRLLQQQQQQHLLIPSNAAAAEITTNIQNIDSLLNNAVAPNVSLQRSSSVPEPQSSPNYNQINQQNQRVNVNNQQPYSPHSQLTSPIQQQANFPQTSVASYQQNTARLSPIQSAVFAQQLSPRQAYPQGNANIQNSNWSQQARLSVQNPMLNAQLTDNYLSGGPNGRNFQRAPQQQQQRSMNSPGTRHSPFAADSFPPPTSPNSAFSQNQYMRLQRTNSAPTATTHLPGGLGSPRPYGREVSHPHPYPPNIPPSHHPMMYPPDAQYCYDQTGLQIPYNGADRGGRVPHPHLHAGMSGGGGATSEFVRQELRAVVGARSGQSQPQQNRPQAQLHPQQQQQVPADLDALGLTFETDYYGGGTAR